MPKSLKIEVVKRLLEKGLQFEAEVACEELHLSKKYLKGGKK